MKVPPLSTGCEIAPFFVRHTAESATVLFATMLKVRIKP